MDSHAILVFAHILLMVFWIGTDIGVFIAGFYMMDTRLSIPERQTAIGLGMVIDRFPRLCFIAMIPVGLQLAVISGSLSLAPEALLAVWLAASVWLVAALTPMLRPSNPYTALLHGLERVMQVAATISLGGAGAWMLLHPAGMGWLATKLIMLGLVCLLVIFLEWAFGPPMAAFAAICTDGSTPQREQQLRRGMTLTYVWVVAIYLAVLVAAYMGIAKPF